MKNLTISNLEVLNTMAWYSQLSNEKQTAIPMKLRFYLKKLINKLADDGKQFENFRDSEIKILQNKYSSDDMSYDEMVPITDENGKLVLDKDGNQETQQVRKVKDEFLADYQADVQALNDKLAELLNDKNTYEVPSYDIEKMVEELPDDTPLEFDDINILDAIFTDNGEAH